MNKEEWKRIDDECEEFNNWLDRIIPQMKSKFRQKAVNGYSGWDDVRQKTIIEMKLLEHVCRALGIEIEETIDVVRERGQVVDIINLAVFKWVIDFYEGAGMLNKNEEVKGGRR